MPRFTDFYSDGEVKDIMERIVERFPDMFKGFDTESISFLTTKKKKSARPIRLLTVGYPMEALVNKPYVVEAFEARWLKLNPKQKNLAVFHIMCAIPEGGFTPGSNHYAKKVKPEITMYLREFAASGGVPNWMENPAAVDPMETTTEKMADVVPVIEALPDTDEVKDIKKTKKAKANPVAA